MKLPEAFDAHPAYLSVWIVTFWLCIVPEIVLSALLRSGKTAQKSDKGSKLIVIGAANLAMILGFSVAIAFPGLSIHTHWRVLFDMGIAVWLSGTLFRFYSMRILGRFFTYDVAVSAGQHVVERGPYRWIRHPSYLGSLVANIGLGMTLTNWLANVHARTMSWCRVCVPHRRRGTGSPGGVGLSLPRVHAAHLATDPICLLRIREQVISAPTAARLTLTASHACRGNTRRRKGRAALCASEKPRAGNDPSPCFCLLDSAEIQWPTEAERLQPASPWVPSPR